jgi:hypothetical protein
MFVKNTKSIYYVRGGRELSLPLLSVSLFGAPATFFGCDGRALGGGRARYEQNSFKHGTLIEGEGSVRLTSILR